MIPARFAQYSHPVVGVGADRRPAWRIVTDIAGRLGLDPLLPPTATTSDEAVLRELFGYDIECADFTWGKVQDYRPTVGWVADRVLPNHRWRLAPTELVDQLARDAARVVGPASDRLLLVPRRQLRHMNSALVDGGGGAARVDEPFLQIHPADANDARLVDGDVAEIRSDHGRAVARAQLDDGMRIGVVSLPHGFVDTNVNVLTSAHDEVDPLTGMVTLSGVPVTVAPVE